MDKTRILRRALESKFRKKYMYWMILPPKKKDNSDVLEDI
jgi:hypothetical protein